MGIHTGEPLIASTGYVGMDVHRAARIGDAGHSGQILLSQTTRELVIQDLPEGMTIRDLGEHRLKDMKYPSSIYQLVVEGLPAEFAPIRTKFTGAEAPTPGEPPFKGLQFFDENDSSLFFGRETLTAKLMNRLNDVNFLSVIIGASGSGKSSLVRAGLVPTLKKKGSTWQVHVITPTAHPLEALAIGLTQESESVTAAATLVDDLAKDPRSLHFFLSRRIRSQDSTAPSHTLLVIDQFEELFTLCRDEFEREAFIDNLLTALTPAPLPLGEERKGEGDITLIITLRADFYAHLAQYPELRDAVAQQQEYIGPMTSEELRRAIEEPARRGHWEFEPGLVDLILRDVGDEPGALPLLSHALLETWKRRAGHTLTLKGYADAGGVHGAIAHTAESVYQNLSLREQTIVRSILLRLTEFGEGTEDTRRRASFEELMSHTEDPDQVRAVLNTLAEARLVTLSEDTAEVAHEALIREWPQLREWLSQDREGIILHRHLTEAAHEWELLERDAGSVYRGARLAQANEWSSLNPNILNARERTFLDASNAQGKRDEQEREDQLQRELDSAKELAETQSQSASRLRTRNRVITTVGSIAIILAILAGAFGLQSNQNAARSEQNLSAAQINAALAEAAKEESLNAQATAEAERERADESAQIAFSRELAVKSILNLTKDTERSVLLALAAYNTAHTKEATDALHEAVMTSRVLLTVNAASDFIEDVTFSPDGKQFASASVDKTVKVWDTATGQELINMAGHTDAVHAVWFSADGKQLASASEDGSVKLWDPSTGKEKLTINVGVPVFTAQFGPDGTWLATGASESQVRFWDTSTGQELFALTNPDWGTGKDALVVANISLSRDGKRLAITLTTQTNDAVGKVEFWDVPTRQRERTLYEGVELPSWNRTMNFSPDGTRFAARSDGVGNGPAVWDANTGRKLYSLGVIVNMISFSSDGRRLLTATSGGKAQVWDAETGHVLLTLLGHNKVVSSVDGNSACVYDVPVEWCGTRLVSGAIDGVIKVWDITPDGRGEGPILSGADFTIDDNWSHLTTFETSTDKPDILTAIFQKWSSVGSGLSQLSEIGSFSVDGPSVDVFQDNLTTAGHWITFSPDGTIHILDAKSQATAPTSLCCFDTTDNNAPNAAAASLDGKLLAVGSKTGTVELWDINSSKKLKTLTVSNSGQSIKIMALSPDGKRLATGFSDASNAKVWDIATGQLLLTLSGQSGQQPSLTFSPDGKLIGAGSCDASIFVWDAVTGEKKLSLFGHSACITSLTFSLDNTRLASGSPDHSIRIWDLKTGKALITLPISATYPRFAFSPDNKLLLASILLDIGRKLDTRIFLLNPDDLIALAKSRLTRGLTTQECQQYLRVEVCPAAP